MMVHRLLGIAVAASLAAFPVCAGANQLASPSSCLWHVVASPNVVPEGNDLTSVTALNVNDAWAGGTFLNSSGRDHPFFEHWNGTKWSIVFAPYSGAVSYVFGVTEIAANDVWAVGIKYATSPSAGFKTLTEHWNGTKWTVVASPNVNTNNYLFSVSANATNDVWAVGSASSGAGFVTTLVEHWNGTKWAVVSSQNAAGGNTLSGIAAFGSEPAWAVGASNGSSNSRTLAEEFNGHSWQIVSTPDASSTPNTLNAVTGVSGKDVWAVGDYEDGSVANTLAEHWNGTTWSIVATPNESTHATVIFGAAAVTSTDVIAVGHWANGAYMKTFAMKWNGSTWVISPTPSPYAYDNFLNAATRIPGSFNVWTVGATNSANHALHHTLIEELRC